MTKIVYGASIEEIAKLGRIRIALHVQEIVDRFPLVSEVVTSVIGNTGSSLYA